MVTQQWLFNPFNHDNNNAATEIPLFLPHKALPPLPRHKMLPGHHLISLWPHSLSAQQEGLCWAMKGEEEVNKCSWCFSMCSDFALGQSTVINRGQVSVSSLSFGSFNSFYLNLEEVKERWRESLLGADGSRQKVQGLLSDREPLSSAYLKFSLCLITNRSPDSTRAKRRKAGPPQPSSLLIPSPLSFSFQPCDSGRCAGL